MKIWRNDKRVVEGSKYTYCADCGLQYVFPNRSRAVCLAIHFKIRDTSEVCLNGYKYETDV